MTQENAGADAVLGAAATMAGGAIGAAVGVLGQATAALKSMAAPSTQHFHVDQDNVMKAGRIIQEQSAKLNDALALAMGRLHVDVDGESEGVVGANIASAWNTRLTDGEDSYVGRIQQYVVSLDNLASQLRESAKQYGFTDEEITSTFGPMA